MPIRNGLGGSMERIPARAGSAARHAVFVACGSMAVAFPAMAADPIRIGVISEAQAVAGASIAPAAQLAADEINAKGGIDGRKIEIVSYDDHSSAAEAVRAFQRAVSEDKVNAVIASYTSEVVLALEPWAARLKTVMITPGAASDVITQNIAKDYEHNKYTFHGYLTSTRARRPGLRRRQGPAGDAAQDEDGRHRQRGRGLDDAARRRLRGLPGEDRPEGARPHPLLARHDRLHADLQQDRRPQARRDDHRHLARRHPADRAVEDPAGADPDARHLVAGHQFDVLEGHQRRDRRRALQRRLRARAWPSRPRRCPSSTPTRRSTATCRPIRATPPTTRST